MCIYKCCFSVLYIYDALHIASYNFVVLLSHRETTILTPSI